jgi:AcrR family transcriptional regulator
MASKKRIGAEQSAMRAVLLDATDQLVLKEGYAAVTTRRVARDIGIAPALVHYYFPTTDDLVLAALRRVMGRFDERLSKALASARPIQSIWELMTDTTRTALNLEFMAMANHRKAIRSEIARYGELFRRTQTKELTRYLKDFAVDSETYSPIGLVMILASISRSLVSEESLGLWAGHAEARAIVHRWIRGLEANRKAVTRKPKRAATKCRTPARRKRKT